MYSPDRFDQLRAENPDLGFALYAIEPGGPVTLEVYTPDGQVFPFTELTAEAALSKAFPPPEDVPEPSPAPAIDIFA